MAKYIMSLDQGTTSCRCILFDRAGRIRSMAQKEFSQIYPQPGWVEHDPREIWASQMAVAAEAMAKVGASAADIATIGITNQRETTVVWDRRTGEPVYNAIVWQCRRTADMIGKLIEDGMGDYVRETTGLVPDPYFSATKITWILENVPGARERAEAGQLAFGTIDSWLIWHLTGGVSHITDVTNASRTMLFNINEFKWDRKILDYFHIPAGMLPEVRPSSCMYGFTKGVPIGNGIAVSGAAGDQQAALFGQCCFEPGEVKNTYGTGCFLLMNTGSKAVRSENGLLTTIAASAGAERTYALEGSIFIAGAGVQWLRDELNVIKSASESEVLAASVPDTAGVYIVPAFTGLGAPYWNANARGTVTGITRGCRKEHFVRALLESMAYQTRDLVKLMVEESGVPISALKVDGGAAVNDFLMQFQADILNAEVVRPACIETTAMGAAFLAGLSVGFWKNTEDLKECISEGRKYVPGMNEETRARLTSGWERAVKTALYQAELEHEQ